MTQSTYLKERRAIERAQEQLNGRLMRLRIAWAKAKRRGRK